MNFFVGEVEPSAYLLSPEWTGINVTVYACLCNICIILKCLGGSYAPQRSQLANDFERQFQRLPHVIVVKLSNEINGNAVQANQKWEIQYGGLQTENADFVGRYIGFHTSGWVK